MNLYVVNCEEYNIKYNSGEDLMEVAKEEEVKV
jgi:hypothetical protein